MKNSKILLVCLGLSLITPSCKTKSVAVEKKNGAVKLTTPFSESKYQSDKDYFREVKSGNSPDQSFAEDIALTQAKAQMASNIQTKIKKSIDIYKKGYNAGGGKDFESKQEGWQREITEMSMSNIHVIGKELYQETDGSYTYYIAIEAEKKEVFNKLSDKVSAESKSRVDFDEKKYKEDIQKEFSDYSKTN